MTKYESLINLIKSLSFKEKRDFKIFSGKHNTQEPNYLILYNLLLTSLDTDEQKIKKRYVALSNDPNYTNTRTYLLKKIIESLRIHHKENSDIIKECEILAKRGLIDMALETAQTIQPPKNILDKINYLNLQVYLSSLTLLINDDDSLKRHNKLQESIEEFKAKNQVGFLYNQCINNTRKSSLNLIEKLEYAQNTLEEILTIGESYFSNNFHLRKARCILELAKFTNYSSYGQEYAKIFVEIWKTADTEELSPIDIVSGLMNAIRFLNNPKATLDIITEMDEFILNHPNHTVSQRNYAYQIKFHNILEFCIINNVELEKVVSNIEITELINYILTLKPSNYGLQAFICNYLSYTLNFNLYNLTIDTFNNPDLIHILKNDYGNLIGVKNIRIMALINLKQYRMAKNLISRDTKYIQRKRLYTDEFKSFFKILNNIIKALEENKTVSLLKQKKELDLLTQKTFLIPAVYFNTTLIKCWLSNNPLFEE